MSNLLSLINEPNDIKKISPHEYKKLAKEIREFLIEKISVNGGHLASNLGVVELTMALHLYLDLPKDKLIWDVGHQSYTHKILTGRKEDFDTLRQFNGLSGFPKHVESDCDSFDTGHSSTSVSVACGFVKARELSGKDNKVVAVIGDGALSGGMAFEALNNAGRFKSNLIIVLNDNNMSISKNVGGMSRYLGSIRTNSSYTGFKRSLEDFLNMIPLVGKDIVRKLKKSKDSIKQLFVPGMLFENMGITYIGPIDGHNIAHMMQAFDAAGKLNGPVLVHVVTKKGKGYSFAEKNPAKFHGIGAFDIKTGNELSPKAKPTYTEVFSKTVMELAENDKRIVAVSAAMADGTGLSRFSKRYPNRFFDVGIAEEHAVTFAAAMAAEGYIPIVAIYSTFLQRAYDQIIHDVCKNRLHVIFAIDRAGIVGNDGETHQGIFDISYLTNVPGLTVLAPKNDAELVLMLRFAYAYDGPVAIRYPRGCVCDSMHDIETKLQYGRCETIREGDSGITFLALGSMVSVAEKVSEKLALNGLNANVINLRFASPLDKIAIKKLSESTKLFVTMEENVKRGGIGETIGAYLTEECQYSGRFIGISLPDSFLSQGNPLVLKKLNHIDEESIFDTVWKAFQYARNE